MARSIHTTHSTLSKLRKQKFATPEARAEAIGKAGAELWKKRRIKKMVKRERELSPPMAGTATGTIPIKYLDVRPHTHHGLTLADTRALLSRLPHAATEAISRIQFSLGKAYMEKFEEQKDHPRERDPLTGRPGEEYLPGAYSAPVLGTYYWDSGLIAIYAYVFDREKMTLPANIYETYLRIQTAKTLIHEIAHHHDYTQRVRRGRWLADREENTERYAESMEHRWAGEVVIPFLEQTYPAQVAEFLDWVEVQGGIRLPLDFFFGDPRTTGKNGMVRLVWSTHNAFAGWTMELAKCAGETEARLAFAWELHFADQYEKCLLVLDKVLGDSPGNIPAQECKADTLVHLEKYEAAMEIADWLMARNASNQCAWTTRADIFEAREDWLTLLETCRDWENAGATADSLKEIWKFRAVAFCALDRAGEMRDALDQLLALRVFKDAAAKERSRAFWLSNIHRRAGKPQPDEPSRLPKSH